MELKKPEKGQEAHSAGFSQVHVTSHNAYFAFTLCITSLHLHLAQASTLHYDIRER